MSNAVFGPKQFDACSIEMMIQLKTHFSLWRVALLTLALLLPAFFSGGALPFSDSMSYIKGGAVAVEKVSEIFKKALPDKPAPIADAPNVNTASESAEEKIEKVHGMRSATYSAYAYLTSLFGVNGLMIVAGQSALVAFVVVLFLRSFAPSLTNREFAAIVGVIALLTTAPWYGSFAMPDILAAGATLSLILFFVYLEELSLFEKLTLGGIAAFAITAHPSNILLFFGLTGLGILERLIREYRAKKGYGLQNYSWMVAPLLVSVIALLAISTIGFGQASVAPKRYPYALARSITDGPALWHLEKHCETYKYAVCEVYDEFPRGVGEFLWESTGLRYQATPEQLDRIRDEEMIILQRATQEYPFAQVRLAIINTIQQLYRVGMPAIGLGQKLTQNENGVWYMTSRDTRGDVFVHPLEYLQIFVLYLSLAALAFFAFKRKSVTEAQLRVIGFFGATLIGNAIICGVLSGPADRFQGRLIWILPLIAAAMIASEKPWKKMT